MNPSGVYVLLIFVGASLANGQGTCPDNTPSSVTCRESQTCPKDHLCLGGICCPSCHRRVEESAVLNGAFVPQCDLVGNFSAEQCHASTSVCWCATEVGLEIPNTRVVAGSIRRFRCADERVRFSGFPKQNSKALIGGQCPTPLGLGKCINYCSTDSDCQQFGRKCCSNGCGKQCIIPVSTNLQTNINANLPVNVGPNVPVNVVPTVHASSGPILPNSQSQNVPVNFPSNMPVTTPVQPNVGVTPGTISNQVVQEKLGNCPRIPNRSFGSTPSDECSVDAQCYAIQKCCSTAYGKKCLTPEVGSDLGSAEVQKPGLCPKTLAGKGFSRVFRNDRCLKDNDCPGQLKCCDMSIGRGCVDILSLVQTDTDQQSQCDGVNEEFQSCGEACPKACDTLLQPTPVSCVSSGCAAGCFCKPGFVRQDSLDPRSQCIQFVQCQLVINTNSPVLQSSPPIQQTVAPVFQTIPPVFQTVPPVLQSLPPVFQTIAPFPQTIGQLLQTVGTIAPIQIPSLQLMTKFDSCPSGPLNAAVAQSLISGVAQQCASDINCSGDQKCCNPPPPYATTALRCMCMDPNAFWQECGPVGVETCDTKGEISLHQCLPSCVCIEGYVKQTSAQNAICVPRSLCVASGVVSGSTSSPVNKFSRATAKLSSNLNADGILNFEQIGNSVLITGTVRGLPPGQHAFTIHNAGDISNGCNAVGPHFDPERQDHGSPLSPIRHQGDLGNINTDINGFTSVNIHDNRISLNGPNSIIGRSIVIHEDQDDFGLGTGDSKKNGNSGQPIACGVIGV